MNRPHSRKQHQNSLILTQCLINTQSTPWSQIYLFNNKIRKFCDLAIMIPFWIWEFEGFSHGFQSDEQLIKIQISSHTQSYSLTHFLWWSFYCCYVQFMWHVVILVSGSWPCMPEKATSEFSLKVILLNYVFSAMVQSCTMTV